MTPATHDPDMEETLLNYSREDYNTISLPQPRDKTRKTSSDLATLQLLGYLFSALYLLFISLKFEAELSGKIYWSYSSIPLILLMVSFTTRAILSISNPRKQMKNLGRVMLTMVIFSTDCLFIIFNVLACLNADGFVHIRYIVMFIPLLVLAAIVFYFVCFLMPGFLDTENRLYKEASLLIAYYSTILISTILLSLRLDNLITWKYSSVLVPIYCAIGLHTLFLIKDLTSKSSAVEFSEVLILLLMTTFLVLYGKNLDYANPKTRFSWLIVFSPLLLLVGIGLVKSFALVVRKRRLT